MRGYFKFGCPVIELIFEGTKIETLLDIGFNGHLMLPKNLIDKIDLEQIGLSDYSTASGEKNVTKVFKGKLEFLGEEIEVPILATEADFSLAGMDLFQKCKIIIDKDIVEVVKSD